MSTLDDTTAQWIEISRDTEAAHPVIERLLWPHGRWSETDASCNTPRIRETVEILVKHKQRLLDSLDPNMRVGFRDVKDIPCVEQLWEQAQQDNIEVFTPDRNFWPHRRFSYNQGFISGEVQNQRHTKNGWSTAPYILWGKGQGETLNLTQSQFSLGVVGTRNASSYGRGATRKLVSGLSTVKTGDAEPCIISGGAAGIDTAAHRTALEADIATIVVCAHGLDRVYPQHNRGLFHTVENSGGLLLSEYIPGTPPGRHRFLTRNRIVALLSAGVLVVEAPWRSGALNTISWAHMYKKPVMAVPGPITVSGFGGCHDRIKRNEAIMVTSSEDIIQLLDTNMREDQSTIDLNHEKTS